MNGTYRHYAILYNFSYMAIGALTPLIGQYLSSLGYSGAQIGWITATGTSVAIFASAFWGGVYSKTLSKHRLLILLLLMAACMNAVFSAFEGFAIVLVTFGVMYFFQAPILSLTDAYAVSKTSADFGGIRTWGAVGFALGVFVTARLASLFSLSAIFPVYIGSFLIAAAALYVIGKRETGAISEQGGRRLEDDRDADARAGFKGYRTVLKDRRLRQLILCTFLMGGTNIANNTYFSFLYTEGGGSLAGVGVCMLIMVGSEAPFMAWSTWLANKFTMERITLAAMMVSVLRFGAYAAGPSWWVLMATGMSQGMVNGIILVEFVRYVRKLAPKGHSSLAISAYYVIGSNLSTILCQLAGGVLLDAAGPQGVYGFFSLMNLAGVILYMAFGLQNSQDAGQAKASEMHSNKNN